VTFGKKIVINAFDFLKTQLHHHKELLSRRWISLWKYPLAKFDIV